MTASPSFRYPFSAAHNRKRRPAFTLQDKALKPKAVLNFVASVDVAPSSSAEMTVNKEMKRSESQTYEEQIKAIFRERSSFYAESRDAIEPEEDNDLWTLKRASPLADEEDEEYTSYESPSKKSKSENLFWDTRLSDSDLFDIAAMMTSR